MDRLVTHGKVIVCRTEAEANAAQVRDWRQRFREGQQAGMIAFSRAEIARLNAAARERMAQDGRLGRDALQVGEREFRVGDRIVCGRNARARLGVVNGTRGQVTALDPDQRALTVTTDDGKTVKLPGWYVAGRGHDDQSWVDHGYAITGHKTQGLTGDDFGVRPSTRADAQWTSVAASRHRFDVRLYLVEELDRPAEDTRHTPDPLDDRVAATVRAMGRPGDQTLAIDQELLAEVRRMTVPQLRLERPRLRELSPGRQRQSPTASPWPRSANAKPKPTWLAARRRRRRPVAGLAEHGVGCIQIQVGLAARR